MFVKTIWDFFLHVCLYCSFIRKKNENFNIFNELLPKCSFITMSMDPLGKCLFPSKTSLKPIRTVNLNKASQPVPRNRTLAANLMARAWNSAVELHKVDNIGIARTASRKWASSLLKP